MVQHERVCLSRATSIVPALMMLLILSGCYTTRPEWMVARVNKGVSWLEKRELIQIPEVVVHVLPWSFVPGQPREIAVVAIGSEGGHERWLLYRYDSNGRRTQKKRISDVHPPFGSLEFLGIDSSGRYGFLQGRRRLLDADGRLITELTSSRDEHVRSIDYDHDGVVDFYSTDRIQGNSPLRVFDIGGRSLAEHEVEARLFDARILDWDNDGIWDLVYVTHEQVRSGPSKYELHIRNGASGLHREMPLPAGGWALSRYPGKGQETYLVTRRGAMLEFDRLAGGETVGACEWDSRRGVYGTVSRVLQLARDRECLLIPNHYSWQGQLVGYSAFSMNVLLYDASGRLIYDEMLDSTYGADETLCAVLPGADGGRDSFLVAERSTVWQYIVAP